MSLSTLADERQLSTIEQLETYLRDGIKPVSEFRIGTEHEKFGWYLSDLRRPEYAENGIEDVLRSFAQFGWVPIREQGTLVGMVKERATITIEPGGQLELSGAPLSTIAETAKEYDEHIEQLSRISQRFGICWSGLGHFPFGDSESAPLMPKPRYRILEKRLRDVGGDGLDMMRQTATVQVNLDFASEADAMRKLRLGLMLHPIVVALFANSAFAGDKWTDVSSRRMQIWETTAPLRTHLPDVLYTANARFIDYIRWSLEAPMLFIFRNERYVDCTGISFEEYMKQGLRGHEATIGDYALHLSTLFPDVRLKKFLEIRGADMGTRSQVLSLPALFKGLFYYDASLDALDELFRNVGPAVSREAARSAARKGLNGKLMDKSLSEWAHQVIGIARTGLEALEPGTTHYLDTLLPNAQRRARRAQAASMSGQELLNHAALTKIDGQESPPNE